MSASSCNLATFVARLQDNMILVATMDNAIEEEYKRYAKSILKSLKSTSASRCTIEAGPYHYHYLIESGVVYLTLVEKGAIPRKLVFQYLEDVQREFQAQHGAEVMRFSRPYAAVSFDPRMSKLRREYLDPSSPANVKKLNSDLSEIHNIMTSSINELIQRGEKLDVMEHRTSNLLSESKKFEKYGRYMNLQALWRQWAPIIAVVAIIALVCYIKFR